MKILMIRMRMAIIGITLEAKVRKQPNPRKSLVKLTTLTKTAKCRTAGMKMTETFITQAEKTKAGEKNLAGYGLKNRMMMTISQDVMMSAASATRKAGTTSEAMVKCTKIIRRKKLMVNTTTLMNMARCYTSGLTTLRLRLKVPHLMQKLMVMQPHLIRPKSKICFT